MDISLAARFYGLYCVTRNNGRNATNASDVTTAFIFAFFVASAAFV